MFRLEFEMDELSDKQYGLLKGLAGALAGQVELVKVLVVKTKSQGLADALKEITRGWDVSVETGSPLAPLDKGGGGRFMPTGVFPKCGQPGVLCKGSGICKTCSMREARKMKRATEAEPTTDSEADKRTETEEGKPVTYADFPLPALEPTPVAEDGDFPSLKGGGDGWEKGKGQKRADLLRERTTARLDAGVERVVQKALERGTMGGGGNLEKTESGRLRHSGGAIRVRKVG